MFKPVASYLRHTQILVEEFSMPDSNMRLLLATYLPASCSS